MDLRESLKGPGQRQAMAQTGGSDSIGDQIVWLFSVLWRRKLLILLVAALTAIAGYWFVSGMTPVYTAGSAVMVKPRAPNTLELERGAENLRADLEGLSSEMELIRSPETIRAVIERLDLSTPPGPSPGVFKFRGAGGDAAPDGTVEPGALERAVAFVSALPGRFVDLITRARPDLPRAEVTEDERDPQAGLNSFIRSRLDVEPVGRSRVIAISFTSTDPVMAARIANAVAEVHIERQVADGVASARRANDWLSQEIADLTRQVQEAERRIEEFRASSGLVSSGAAGAETTLPAQEMAALNARLSEARTQRAQADARLAEAQRLGASAAGIDALPDVLASPLIQGMRARQSTVRAELAELRRGLGDRHPTVVDRQAQLADLDAGINAEVRKIVEGLRAEARIAAARVTSIQAEVDAARGEVVENNDAAVQLRGLVREAEAMRTMLEHFLSRSRELGVQQSYQDAAAEIVSRASIPGTPSFPKMTPVVAGLLFVGLCLGVGLAAVREVFDRGFRSGDQIRTMTPLVPLGLAPRIGRLARRRNPAQDMLDRGNTAYAEAIRGVYANLVAHASDRRVRTVMVTSAFPGEGKTTTAVSLGMFAATVGMRVVVVDFDVRRSSTSAAVGSPPGPGLLECFRDKATLEEATWTEPRTGMHLLRAGTGKNVSDMLDPRKLRSLLDVLEMRYDLVVFDSAPALAVSETRLLSRFVDGLVFVVRWGRTSRGAVQAALDTLDLANLKIAGGLITQVDVRRHSQYLFNDSGLYHRGFRRYYTG